MLILTYDKSKASLGRCTEGYQHITDSPVKFTPQPGTVFVRLTFAVNNDIDLASYASSINTARAQVFSVRELYPMPAILNSIDASKTIYPALPFENTGNNIVLGKKIDVVDNEYTPALVGALSSATESRQGGAIYGDYLFQFHNTLANIVVFKLSTATNIQTLTLTAISNCHAGSGGFGASFYAEGDAFPLLYISSMDEKKVYVFRITGTEGAWNITKVQEITLSVDFYLPNIAIDALNGRGVLFGYTANSWSSATDNNSAICFFDLPAASSGNVTISTFYNYFELPFLYAQQGACARYGKLYLSFGNTGAGLNTGGIEVIDYISKNVESYLDLKPVTVSSFEPEALGIWNGGLVVTEQGGSVYKLTF